MKKSIYTSIVLSLVLCAISLFSRCTKESEEVSEVFRMINQKRPDLGITEAQVKEMMSHEKGGSPCGSDYNEDGVVNTGDLGILLALIGTKGYSVTQLNQLLAVFGQEYIIEVIISYNNFIDTVFGCVAGWEVYQPVQDRWLIRKRCNGTLSWYSNFDSLHWVHNGEVVSRVEEKLRFQTYLPDGTPNECTGWQPPCNGINLVGMRVFDNGHTFYREALGYASVNNVPDTIPICGNAGMTQFLFGTDFLPYEHLEQ